MGATIIRLSLVRLYVVSMLAVPHEVTVVV